MNHDTNLAAEFYILSCLHRQGADATLTLANKKSVDIVVIDSRGQALTVDVKGVAGPHDWPADNIRAPRQPNQHFLAFLSFEGKIDDLSKTPAVWIVPYTEVESLVRQYDGRRNVSRSLMKSAGECYRNNWHPLIGTPAV